MTRSMRKTLPVLVLAVVVGTIVTVSILTENENTGVLLGLLAVLVNQVANQKTTEEAKSIAEDVQHQTNGMVEKMIDDAVNLDRRNRRATDPPDSTEYQQRGKHHEP